MSTKKALVLYGGTMRGAFIVGALRTIHRLLGVNYFDAIFATSVGVFEQAFFASNQPEIMEYTWQKYVHGNQLINFMNPLRGRPILDLDYLTDLFQSEKSLLDLKALEQSHPKLFVFLTNHATRKPILVNLKENDVFQIMKATCALPILYPKKIIIGDKRYVDSWMASTPEFNQILRSSLREYDEIIAITPSEHIGARLDGLDKIIKPSKMPLRNALDTNQNRIIQTIEQGKLDAEKFIIDHNLVSVKI